MSDYSAWTEAELLRLIAEKVRERDDLEYKRSQALRPRGSGRVARDVSIDVSAMANANGGLILYGMEEQNHEPTKLDGGFDQTQAAEPNHEWLEQVIRGNVRPAPDVLIKPIELTALQGRRIALLVDVHKSPHGCQANNRKYYRRRNFQNEELDDWEVRELMSRTTRPAPELTHQRKTLDRGGPGGGRHVYAQVIELHNRGEMRIRDWKVEISFPQAFLLNAMPSSDTVTIQPTRGATHEAQRIILSNRERGPLFPGESVLLTTISWLVDDGRYQLAEDTDFCLAWSVYADDATPIRDGTLIREMHEF